MYKRKKDEITGKMSGKPKLPNQKPVGSRKTKPRTKPSMTPAGKKPATSRRTDGRKDITRAVGAPKLPNRKPVSRSGSKQPKNPSIEEQKDFLGRMASELRRMRDKKRYKPL